MNDMIVFRTLCYLDKLPFSSRIQGWKLCPHHDDIASTLLPSASMLQMAQSLKQAEIEAKYKES